MAKIGYARVSTIDQSLDSQIDELKKVGCEKIFSEKISGRKAERQELTKWVFFPIPPKRWNKQNYSYTELKKIY